MKQFFLLYFTVGCLTLNYAEENIEKWFVDGSCNELVSDELVTEEHDGFGHRKVCYYTPNDDAEKNNLISVIETYEVGSDGDRLISKEKFSWDASVSGIPALSVRSLEDGEGTVFLAVEYNYDENGNVIERASYGNLTGQSDTPVVLQDNGYPNENSGEKHTTYYVYSDDYDKPLLLNQLDDFGNVTSYVYNEENALIDVIKHYEDKPDENSGALYSLLNATSSIYASLNNFVWNIEEIESRLAERIHQSLGTVLLTMSGWHMFTPEAGTYGKGEINDKVRITMINGILNLPETCEESLDLISNAHNGTNLHYIFRPTEGWTWDLLKSLFVKIGYVSESSKLLAQLWKELIQEMGGTEGGGLIIHYAHSVGGTETYAASSLLTPEERKMIRIISIGSASMIPDTLGHESVVNYVSLRDGVCLLDTHGYLNGLVSSESNVVFLGDLYGVPLVDHLMTMDTYRELIENLGKKFLEDHGKEIIEYLD